MTSGTSETRTPARADGSLVRLAARTAALTGWRRGLLAVGLGVLAVLALPPVHAVPLLIPAFTGLVWQLGGVPSRWGAFGLGWAFGLGFFGAGLHWIGHAFLVDAATYGWMMPFAVAGLSGGLAIFTGLALAAAWSLPVQSLTSRALAAALMWMLASWLRGHILTGFPWNLLASVWAPWPTMLQSAAVFGAWGLSAVTVLAACAPAALGASGSRAGRWALPGIAACLLGALALGGSLRLHNAPVPGGDTVEGVTLRLVQPSIPQHLKWRDGLRRAHLQRYLEMSRRPGKSTVTHVIWPETAIPLFLSRTNGLAEALGTAVPKGGALLTGLPRIDTENGQPRLYNTLGVFDGRGQSLARYDKFHLVPFGEYVPLSDWLPIEQLAQGRTGFSAGPGPRTLRVPGVPPVSPLICYEAIFPGAVTDDSDRPGWLLNVTNDAWFGQSSGPYQHLASARLRSVEEGLPLVRAANTGVSVVIDPWGRTLGRLDLNETGVLDRPLPRALPPTLYAAYGDGLFVGLLVLMALGVIFSRKL